MSEAKINDPAEMTSGQAATRLDVSMQTIVNWCDQGRLRSRVTGGGHRRIPTADVEALAPTLPNAQPVRRFWR